MAKNVLFITTDQQHYMAMGYRNSEVKTPNLDRLVKEGTSFHRAYTPNPTCTPTRSSWLTGQYPSQHGAWSLGTKLLEDRKTIGSYLREGGVTSALVGKAHFQPLLATDEYPSLESYPTLHDLDFWREKRGDFYGFDRIELARNHTDEGHVGQHYAIWMEERGLSNWRDYFLPNAGAQKVAGDPLTESTHTKREPGQAWEIPVEYHYNAWIAERTNAFMTEYASEGKRFFLWASFFDPHPTYMVPEPYASMYDPAKVTVPEHVPGEFDDKPPYFKKALEENPDFSDLAESGGNHVHGSGSHLRTHEEKAKNIAMMYGMMTMLDDYIGKILDQLDELGLANDTLVCFTTDHGDFWGQHGLVAKAIHHYEDLIKVPLVVRQPGVVPEGVISDSLQSTLDVVPTFLAQLDLPVPREMTGVDESAVWTGSQASIRDHVIVENQHQPTTMNMRTLVTDRYKLTVHYNQSYGELYDLQEDPGEIVNLWDHEEKQPLKCELLLKFMHGEMAKTPLPMPRIAPA
ncbi:MAG: sulfatase-like hydrolase/transferase [Spirochaetales bacterium]